MTRMAYAHNNAHLLPWGNMIAGPARTPAIDAAAIAIAALALLQPGIDPLFLALLSSAGRLDPADHGWIVGATQAGMAVGALIAWRYGERLPRNGIALAAACALIAALATPHAGSLWSLIALRILYGGAMGLIFTQTMASLAAVRPTSAYGVVFLVQLLLSTLVALLVPLVANYGSSALAVAMFALVPASLLLLAQRKSADRPESPDTLTIGSLIAPKAAWALLAATFWFVCTTMIVWSFAGALAIAAGIHETTIGHAVAIGSVAGVVTAACVARDRPVMPLIFAGPLAGFCLLAPLFLTRPGQEATFILAIVLLNIGSTAMVIRCSGVASARGGTSQFRRLVTASHSIGMIAGPVIGAILTHSLGLGALALGAFCTLAAACSGLLAAALWDRDREKAGRTKALIPIISRYRS